MSNTNWLIPDASSAVCSTLPLAGSESDVMKVWVQSRQAEMSKQSESPRSASRKQGFEQTYPTIAQWIDSWGWIEIGRDGYSQSMARALDEGGMVWEGKAKYSSVDELLRDLEKGISCWLEKNG